MAANVRHPSSNLARINAILINNKHLDRLEERHAST